MRDKTVCSYSGAGSGRFLLLLVLAYLTDRLFYGQFVNKQIPAMKNALSIVAAFLIVSTAAAQESVLKPISIGPAVTFNVTRNIVDYKVAGPDRSWTLGSQIGVMADIPVGEQYSVIAGLGYYTLSFKDVNKAVDYTSPGGEDRDDLLDKRVSGMLLTTEGSLNYLALTTMFRVSNFCLGFTFGVPLTAKITNSFDKDYQFPVTYPSPAGERYQLKQDISPPSSERNFLVEARIGGDFPIWEHEKGSLHFMISGAYPLTQHLASARGEDEPGTGLKVTLFPSLDPNFRLPSISAGVSYLFNI